MIPFGLLGGFCDHLEIRITGLSEEGFSFRVPEKIEKAACLEICFFDFSADCYRKVQLAEKEREMKLTEETPFFFIYSVWTNSQEMMRIFQKKWLVIRQNWTKFTQRASKSRRKSGSVVLVMEYRSAGIHGSIKSGILQIYLNSSSPSQ